MTTSPVASITDEQLAELGRAVAEGLEQPNGFYICRGIASLIARLRAAEKGAARYRWLQKASPYKFRKIRDASITDGGDVFYFHKDKFDHLVDTAMEQQP